MAYGTLQTDVINSSTGLFSTNNAYLGIAKAWVNFNGTNGVVRSSFNVSSVTRNSICDFTVTMTTAMADINYSYNVNFSPLYALNYSGGVSLNSQGNTTIAQRDPTTTSFRFVTYFFSGAATTGDATYINVIVCGN